MGLLAFSDRGEFEIYYSVQVTVDTKNYKIYRVSGRILIKNKAECVSKQNSVIEDLSKISLSVEKVIEKFETHRGDESGESIANGIYLDLPSGDGLGAECYLWGKQIKEEEGYYDNLTVFIETKANRDFIQNEAY